MGIAEAISRAGLVRRRQVRDLSSLGRLFRSRPRQRVVPAGDVPAWERGVQLPPPALGTAVDVRVQGLHPHVPGGALGPRALGGIVPPGGRQVRGPGGRAPRWLPHVRLHLHRLDRRQDGAAPRRGGRVGPRRSPAGTAAWRLVAPGLRLVLLHVRAGLRHQQSALLGAVRSRSRPHAAHQQSPGRVAPDGPATIHAGLVRAHRPDCRSVPARPDVVRLLLRGSGVGALPPAVRRVLLQPGGRVGTRRGAELQARRLPGGRRRSRYRARPLGRHPPARLADRHFCRVEVLGLHPRGELQGG